MSKGKDKVIIRMNLIIEVPDYLNDTDRKRLQNRTQRQKIAEISVQDMLRQANIAGASAIVINSEYRRGDNQ